MKIKKRKQAKSSFRNGGGGEVIQVRDWLITLMMMLIVIIIDYYPALRVSLFLYILQRSPNLVSYPRSLLSLAKFDVLSSCFLRTALLVRELASSHLLTTVSGKIISSFVSLNFHSVDSHILEQKNFSCV